MRQRKPIILAVLLAAVMVAMGAAVLTPASQPQVRLVVTHRKAADKGDHLTMELRSPDVVIFDHIRQFQVQVGSTWELPEEPGCCGHTFNSPGSQRLFVARVPHAATAVRIACDCRRVGLLGRLELLASRRWPVLDQRIVAPQASCFPQPSVWHPITAEVQLRGTARTSAHNLPLHWTGSSRFSSVSMASSLAAAPGQ